MLRHSSILVYYVGADLLFKILDCLSLLSIVYLSFLIRMSILLLIRNRRAGTMNVTRTYHNFFTLCMVN